MCRFGLLKYKSIIKMSKNPSDNKRKRDQDDVEDPELNQTTKRQKLDDGKDAKASPNKAVSPSKK